MITSQIRSAILSDDGLYRYQLLRSWDEGKPLLNWIMLNPSIANAEKDDATIRRCIRFSNGWGYGKLAVYNLFALISTNPKNLLKSPDPIGPRNDFWLSDRAKGDVVLAWGSHGAKFPRRKMEVMRLLTWPINIYCLGKTKEGEPKHPLRLSAMTRLEPWV
jgi:hypothetical protein